MGDKESRVVDHVLYDIIPLDYEEDGGRSSL